MMKAVYINEYGNAEKLIHAEIERPVIRADQVLIKVSAAGVNPVDWMIRDGYLKESGYHQLPLILGWDVAGEIAEIGAQVTGFELGDAVFSYAPIAAQGGYAQYIAVESQLVTAKPETLSLLDSAAVPLAATTAWQALVKGCQLKAGDKVLIHNTAGGVGSFAVQIAKALGAYVIATASEAKHEFVKSLGADQLIDYRVERFEDKVGKLDAVLAAVGGDDILQRSLEVIRPGGHLISLLDEIDQTLAAGLDVNYQRWWVAPDAQDLRKIAQLIDSGQVKVIIDKVFPLAQAAQAHAWSESKRATGKIVLEVSAS
ncbi:MAG: NADP-dependent oxidoreductase [Pseudomonadales bacterium]